MSTLNNIKNYSNNEINGQVFKQKYHAYAAIIYWGNKNNDKLECTDKIVLPPSALSKLASTKILNTLNNNPIIFEIANNSNILPKKSHCSVIEFTANDGCAYLPIQIMNNLGLSHDGNDIIELTTVNLPKGQLIQVQPHKMEKILSLSTVPKYIIEKYVNKYSTLTLGDTIKIEYKNNIYKFDITKVKPSIIQSTAPPAINIIECELQIDFKEARDYKQWKEMNSTKEITYDSNSDYNENYENKIDESDSNQSIEYSNDNQFDPPESPEYFDHYGQNLSTTPKTNKSPQNNVFSFDDTNKGFSFCKDKNKDDKNKKGKDSSK